MAKNRRSLNSQQAPSRSRKDSSSATSAPPSSEGVGDAARVSQQLPPSPRLKRLLSVVVVFHFAATLVALASNYSPSYVQGVVMDYLSPYLVTTHQAYGAMPLELTHGNAIDFPVAIEVQREESSNWDKLELWKTGQEERRSRWNSLGRIITIVTEDQPESEVLSEIANQIVRHAEATNTRETAEITAVRIVQPHVMNFEEDLIFASSGESFIEADLVAETLYAAKVVRSDGLVVGMLPVQEASRVSESIQDAEAQP